MTSLKLLKEFIDNINATGGIIINDHGKATGLACDPDWLDMALTYLVACEVIGVRPMVGVR